MPTVEIWLNAFIPRDVPGYTQTLPAGPHIGKTAVPLPGVARFHPFNTFKDWNAGYLTDQRSFSTLSSASVRMRSFAQIELDPPTVNKIVHESSGTTEVNLSSGIVTGTGFADMSRCTFTFAGVAPTAAPAPGATPVLPSPPLLPPRPAATVVPSTPRAVLIKGDVVGQAGDPLVWAAADIDYVGTFTIARPLPGGPLTVSFDGMLDAFPAYEAYASFNGTVKELFTSPPPKGNTVADLLGSANRPITGSAIFV
ncbi:hypothetical protein [Labrys neptuniae]